MPTIGAMRERLIVERRDAATLVLSTLTRAGTTATANVEKAHDLATGDYVVIAGAVEAYNGTYQVIVTGTTTFTFPCTAGLGTPATGAITMTYVSDAQGGRHSVWRPVATVWAEVNAISANEALQRRAVSSDVAYRFRIRQRADLLPSMRARWTPSWPPESPEVTLEIRGIVPLDDGRTFAALECATSPEAA